MLDNLSKKTAGIKIYQNDCWANDLS